MKQLWFVLAAAAVLGFSSCDFDELTQFDMEFNSSITVPASSGINLPFDLFTPEITTNSESTFGSNNTSADLIESIKLKAMNLDITAPGDRDFDFLNSIKIYIDADGLSEILIASLTDIPADVDNIELEVNDNDLKDYLIQEKFKLRVETVTDEFLGNDVNIDVKSTYRVDASILGL